MALALQYSNQLNANRLDAIETLLTNSGASAPKLKLYGSGTGGIPATINTALTDQPLLCDMLLNTDPMAAATVARPSVKAKTATAWTGTGAAAAGAGIASTFFRLCTNADVPVIQGTCGVGASFDLNFDNNSIAQNQTVTVGTFTLTSNQ